MAPNSSARSKTEDYVRYITGDSQPDEEWCTPLQKIAGLDSDDESWAKAKEIIEPISAECHKIGDESRSLVARHIIERLKEHQMLEQIEAQAARLRSAVEILSKPEADYLYPVVRFLVEELRERHAEMYTSVIQNIRIEIPKDERPSNVLVKLAKRVLEDSQGSIVMNWGKFISLLALAGALAVDCVNSNYCEGVTAIVETFGCLVEEFMAPWILSPNGGNGWDSLVEENVHPAKLSPALRTVILVLIVMLAAGAALSVIWVVVPYIFKMLYFLLSCFYLVSDKDIPSTGLNDTKVEL